MGCMCREVIPTSQEHPVPPATSGPCLSHWYLPRRVGAGWESQGVLGWPGQRDTGMQPSPAHCSEGGEEQEAAELRQLLGNSLANLHPVRKHFFQRFGWVFTGAGSGLDDQVVLRSHTWYLEEPRTRFDQKLDQADLSSISVSLHHYRSKAGVASSPADPSQAFPRHPMPQLSFSPYLASLSPQTEWPNLTWKSIQLFWVTTVVFALRAERKQKEDGPGCSQLLTENKQSRTLRAMLGLVVEFSKKKKGKTAPNHCQEGWILAHRAALHISILLYSHLHFPWDVLLALSPSI